MFSTQSRLFETKHAFTGVKNRLFAAHWMTLVNGKYHPATFTCDTVDGTVTTVCKCTEMPNARHTQQIKVHNAVDIEDAYQLDRDTLKKKKKEIRFVNKSDFSEQDKLDQIEFIEYEYKKKFLREPIDEIIASLYENNTCTIAFDHCDSLTGASSKAIPLDLGQVDRFVRFMKSDGKGDDKEHCDLFSKIRGDPFLLALAVRLEKDIDHAWELAIQKKDVWGVTRASVLANCFLCTGRMDTHSGTSAFLPPMFVFNCEVTSGAEMERMIVPFFQKVDAVNGVHFTFHSVPSQHMPLANAIRVIGKKHDFIEMNNIIESIEKNSDMLLELVSSINVSSMLWYEVGSSGCEGVTVFGAVPAVLSGLPADYSSNQFKKLVNVWGLCLNEPSKMYAFEEHWISLASKEEIPKSKKNPKKAPSSSKKAKVVKSALSVDKKIKKHTKKTGVKTGVETKKAMKERIAMARKQAAWEINLRKFVAPVNEIFKQKKILKTIGSNTCENIRTHAIQELKNAFDKREQDFKSNIRIRTQNARLVKAAGAGVDPKTVKGIEKTLEILSPPLLIAAHVIILKRKIAFETTWAECKKAGYDDEQAWSEANKAAEAQCNKEAPILEQKKANLLNKQADRAKRAKDKKKKALVLADAVPDDVVVLPKKDGKKRRHHVVSDDEEEVQVVEEVRLKKPKRQVEVVEEAPKLKKRKHQVEVEKEAPKPKTHSNKPLSQETEEEEARRKFMAEWMARASAEFDEALKQHKLAAAQAALQIDPTEGARRALEEIEEDVERQDAIATRTRTGQGRGLAREQGSHASKLSADNDEDGCADDLEGEEEDEESDDEEESEREDPESDDEESEREEEPERKEEPEREEIKKHPHQGLAAIQADDLFNRPNAETPDSPASWEMPALQVFDVGTVSTDALRAAGNGAAGGYQEEEVLADTQLLPSPYPGCYGSPLRFPGH